MSSPPPEVLDLFAVPGAARPLPGGQTGDQGRSVVAGDLVLSPDRDGELMEWLSPLLARLAVTIDTRPGRDARDLRLAMPVPARDGSWVVEGWAASRYEPGTVACRDLGVTLAAGRVLHAELASWVPVRPEQLATRRDRWARAERCAFGEVPPGSSAGPLTEEVAAAVARVEAELAAYDARRSQLVDAGLAGHVLLDAAGAPVVIDVAPAWRPVGWAEAVCVLDSVSEHGAPISSLDAWREGEERQAMLRALLFRLLGNPAGVAPYGAALEALLRGR